MAKTYTENKAVTKSKDTVESQVAVDLAIVIVSYNTAKLLRRCLLSLKKNPLIDRSCAIVVVDNDSKDGSPQIVRNQFASVILIENDSNLGFAVACNQGIKAVDAKFYLLLNSDAAVMGNALDVLVSFMDANPEVGASGGLIFTEDGNVQPSTLQYPNYWNIFFSRSSILAKLPVFRWKMQELRRIPEEVADVPALAGGFLVVRTEAFERVGLLDERFFIYLEDVDICKRLHKAGWRVCFVPSARILHSWGASSRQRRQKAFWWHHLSMFKYFQKHYPYLFPINILLLLPGLVMHYFSWWTYHTLTSWKSFSTDEKNGKSKQS
jgi:GT2 family glycosyltransferase